MAPSAAPAPSTVWSSSTNRITWPSDCHDLGSSRAFSRCSKAPRNWVPATIPARSSATTRTPRSGSGTLSSGDPQGQALGDRGLADTGLADQRGVVLAPPAEGLDHLLDLGVAPDHRVDPAFARVGGEVMAELIQCRLLRAPLSGLGPLTHRLGVFVAGARGTHRRSVHHVTRALLARRAVVERAAREKAEVRDGGPLPADVAGPGVLWTNILEIH